MIYQFCIKNRGKFTVEISNISTFHIFLLKYFVSLTLSSVYCIIDFRHAAPYSINNAYELFRLCFDHTLLDFLPLKDFMSWKHNLNIEGHIYYY